MPHNGCGGGLSASVLSSEVLVYILEVFMATGTIRIIVLDSVGKKVNNNASPVVTRGIKRNAESVELEHGAGRKRVCPSGDQGRINSAA